MSSGRRLEGELESSPLWSALMSGENDSLDVLAAYLKENSKVEESAESALGNAQAFRQLGVNKSTRTSQLFSEFAELCVANLTRD